MSFFKRLFGIKPYTTKRTVTPGGRLMLPRDMLRNYKSITIINSEHNRGIDLNKTHEVEVAVAVERW